MKTFRRVLFASLMAVPLFSACKKERQVPPGPPPLPAFGPSAQKGRDVHGDPMMAGMPAGHGAPGGHNAAMPADHPPMLRSRSEEAAANQPPGAPAPAADAASSISGTLKLADKLKGKVPHEATVFIVARNAAVGNGLVGPPLAAQRYAVSAWPLPFELSQANVMLEGSQLQGKVVLSARVDQDGDAMTKQVGDLEAISPPIAVPAKNVELTLETIRTQEAGAPSPPNMGGGGGGATMGSGGMPPGHPALPPGHPK